MVDEMILDFSGAPPSAGPISDHIPPGTYVLRVEKMELTTTKKGKPMIECDFLVSRGPSEGKRLKDYFTIPAGEDDSLVGLQRLNSLLVATRGKPAAGRNKASNVIEAITGKECLADVDDRELPARPGYDSALIVSNIVAFHWPKSEAGQSRIAAMRGKTATAQAPAAAAPVADELSDELSDEPAVVEAPTTEPVTSDDAELESLFDD